MRWFALLTLLLAGVAGLLWAADAKKPDDPVKGFTVHEWGVFRVHDDLDVANADMRATWDELPKFVYGQTTTRTLPTHWDRPLMVKKPVIFFHAPTPMAVELRVEFPTGTPAVWWPATFNPGQHGEGFGRLQEKPTGSPQQPIKSLEWSLQLKEPIRERQQIATEKPLSGPHWFKTLRSVKCDDVFAAVGQRNFGLEREKFVYYDGLLPRIDALSIKVEKETLTLKNKAKFAVFDVWLIDNRDLNKPRVGRLPRLDAADTKTVELSAVTEPRWVEDSGKTLTTQLKDVGLNEDEAASLTTIWSAEFFRSAGVTLLYRLPSEEEYDRLLPLTIKPRPEKVVRVGLVQQVVTDPELADRVAKLVKQLDDDDFDKREAAQATLAKMGRAAFGHLRRLKATTVAPEPKRRLEELLEKDDSQRALNIQGK